MPTWLKKPQDSQLEEGKPGYLHCLTQATPKPTVVWYRNQMLISEVRMGIPDGGGIAEHLCSPPGRTVPLSGPLGNDGGGALRPLSVLSLCRRTRGLRSPRTVPCASTAWRCMTGRGTAVSAAPLPVASRPRPECKCWVSPCCWGGRSAWQAGEGRRRRAQTCGPAPQFPPLPSTDTEKLKFTPPPRPQQCMEFDKEATVPCSATGREKPTIKWVRAGGYRVGVGQRAAGCPLTG